MNIKKLSGEFSVGAQVEPADVQAISQAGFKSILCNRPDGEGEGQPSFEAVEAVARENGLEIAYVPVVSGQMTDSNLAAFHNAVEKLPKPVFAYCRTGTRSTALWSLDQGSRGVSPDAIIEAAAKAGYDMAGLRPGIETMSNR